MFKRKIEYDNKSNKKQKNNRKTNYLKRKETLVKEWKEGKLRFRNYSEEISKEFEKNTNIINLHNKNIKLENLEHLKKTIEKYEKKSIELYLSKNDFSPKETFVICETILKENEKIKKLDLSSNKIGKIGISMVFESLENNDIVEELIFDFNNGDDECCNDYINFDPISKIEKLRILNLENNRLSDANIIELAENLKLNKSITHLKLSHNFSTGDGIKKAIETIGNNSSIIDLDIAYNDINVDGLNKIIEEINNNDVIKSLNIEGIIFQDNNDDQLYSNALHKLFCNNKIVKLQIGENTTPTEYDILLKSFNVQPFFNDSIEELNLDNIFSRDILFIFLKETIYHFKNLKKLLLIDYIETKFEDEFCGLIYNYLEKSKKINCFEIGKQEINLDYAKLSKIIDRNNNLDTCIYNKRFKRSKGVFKKLFDGGICCKYAVRYSIYYLHIKILRGVFKDEDHVDNIYNVKFKDYNDFNLSFIYNYYY